MNTRTIMHQWQKHLQSTLPGLHFYQQQGLALFSFAAATAQHCCLSRLCAHAPGNAQPSSTKRRLLRFLGNDRLNVQKTCLEMAQWLSRWNFASCRLLLLMDETPLHNHWRVLKISVAWRRRAIPICWSVYPLRGRSASMEAIVCGLLSQAHTIIQTHAPRAQVELLADRGFCWAQIVFWCRDARWDYVIRAQSRMLVRFTDADGNLCHKPLRELVQKGTCWCGRGEVFRQSGWIAGNIVACWPRCAGARSKSINEPWLLLTSLRPTLHCARHYKRRMWIEQSFRDEKSHGFMWQNSQVGIRMQAPERVNRLVLILALAQLWLLSLGAIALTPKWKRKLGLQNRGTRRLWSLFRHGWQFLQWLMLNTAPWPRDLRLEIKISPT